MFGWTGKLLRVDLTTKKSAIETISLETARNYVGGRGLGAWYLYKELAAQTDPLSPGNPLIFSVGPLTGTRVPTSGRFTVTTKAPLTGTILDSNAGGRWGVELKKCGYDALIIDGASEIPVYLSVKDQEVQIKEASELWGLDVPLTTDRLIAAEGGGSVACIGPAGENLVKFAAIMNDKNRALGRGGVGAVMGSKKLKGILLKGSMKTSVYDREKLEFMLYETNKWLKANPITSTGLPEFGTAVLVNLFNEMGIFPSHNFKYSQSDQANDISGEAIAEKLLVKKSGCHACPIQCSRVTRTSKAEGEGPEYESLWALGPQCGIFDLETITEANYLCNRLGLDTISTGVTIGCAMEMREQGLLEDELSFGDAEGLLDLIADIANRKGRGDLLAEGSYRMAEGLKGQEFSMTVKRMELPAYDPRGVQGMGLGFATSNRGGCHLRAYMVGPEVLGIPKMVDRFAHSGKAGLTIFYQNINAAMDTLIICRFANLAVSEEYFARILGAVTGEDYQPRDLHILGERIWNLEKLFNMREGFGRKDDTLPDRLLKEPAKNGPSKGNVVNLEPMLEEYYRCRGWDKEGNPTSGKLSQLGLEVF